MPVSSSQSGSRWSDLLAGQRIIDWSSGIAGAYCAKLLADHGADVLMVEPPEGNPHRRAGPFRHGVRNPESSGLFLYLNTNKRGLTMETDTAEGRATLERVAMQADVLVTDRLLSAVPSFGNPRLIVTSMTPFGSTGPYARRSGGDLICAAMSGIVRDTPGNVEDLARQPPLRMGGRQGDYATGLVGALATGIALLEREQTGLGQAVDVSEWETLALPLMFDLGGYSQDPTGHYVNRSADRRVSGGYPRTSIGIWPCKDGYVAIAIREQSHFRSFVEVMGNPPWSRDERFMDMAARGENASALNPLILEWLMQHTVAEIWRLALAHDLPISPCNDVRQLMAFDQFRAREFFVHLEHPDLGPLRLPRGPVAFSKTPWRLRRPAPTLGEQSSFLPSVVEANRVGPMTPSPVCSLPLAGVRVVEFTQAMAAPFASFWLAAMGAEVIKVESNEHVDFARRRAPFADGIPGQNRSAMFNAYNLNKRSCTINLANSDGLALARRLVKLSDVVIENLSLRTAERTGITYERLAAVRPDVLFLSCSAVGRTGPARKLPGYAENVTGLSGLAALTGYPDGPPGLPGAAWGDYVSAATLAWAATMALFHRGRTGQGQQVDLAMAEAIAVQIPEAVLDFQLNGFIRGPQGNDDELAAPHGCFPCAGVDQWIAIAIYSDDQWGGLKAALEISGWAEDSRFATVAGRKANQEELHARIAAATEPWAAEPLVELLQAAGVPAGRVMDAPARLADPHLGERGFYHLVEHPETRPLSAAGASFLLGRHHDIQYRHAPVLGEDNEYVFAEVLGLGDEEFAALVGAGAIL